MKKLGVLHRAYTLFNRISMQPGGGQFSFLELQKYLEGLQLKHEDIAAILEGFRYVLWGTCIEVDMH